jgi:hypothetical protein
MHGITWYVDATNECARISDTYSVDFLKVCGMMSALSPGVSWEVNIKDCESLVACLVNGLERPTLSTYPNNISKAVDIFNSDGSHDTVFAMFDKKNSGWKTKSFYLNMSGRSLSAVTVDRHILSAMGYTDNLNKSVYHAIERKFQRKARQLKINACDLQAVVWVNYKRIS